MDNINKFYKKIKVYKESKFIYLINKEINIELSNLIKGQYMDLNTNFDYINKLSKHEAINMLYYPQNPSRLKLRTIMLPPKE